MRAFKSSFESVLARSGACVQVLHLLRGTEKLSSLR
jgi:hypothetical protein